MSGARRVFVMDDSAFALELTRAALAEAGVEVVIGRDLADLTALDEAPFDLVLLDVEMPELYGDDLARMLIDRGVTAPVHLLSSLPSAQLAEATVACGAAGYLEKASGLDAVLARVLALLGLPAHPATARPALGARFQEVALGRLRRIEGALARREPATAAAELHTLAGEAALFGLADVARAAAAARAAIDSAADDPLAVAEARLAILGATLAAAGAPDTGHVAATAPSTPGARATRVLLLDDSNLYRGALAAMLEHAGLEVIEARHLSEARTLLHRGAYDLAVLDLQLDDGLGSDLIPDLRAHAPAAHVVLLTSDPAAASSSGADLVLSKQLDPADLIARLRAARP